MKQSQEELCIIYMTWLSGLPIEFIDSRDIGEPNESWMRLVSPQDSKEKTYLYRSVHNLMDNNPYVYRVLNKTVKE